MAATTNTDRPTKDQLSSVKERYNRGRMYTGLALDFDGANDEINVGDIDDNCRTILCWMKPDSTTEKVIDLDGGTHILEIISGTLTATGFNSATTYVDGHTGSTVQSGVWQMIAATTDTAIDVNNLLIAKSGSTFYDGQLSNVMLFSSKLSASQIEAIWIDPARPRPLASLVGWWPLISDGGLAIDYSSQRNSAPITGATVVQAQPTPVLQLATRAMQEKARFDGSNDYQNLGTQAATSDITISALVYTDTYGSSQPVIAFGSVYFILVSATLINYSPGSGTASFTVPNNSGKFHHIVVTQTGTQVDIYVNGVLAESETVSTVSTASITSYIGRRTSSFFDGIIDEVAVFDKYMEATEVEALFNNGRLLDPRTNSGNYFGKNSLVGYWRNAGTQDWPDLSDNSNDGTSFGSPSVLYVMEGAYGGYTGVGSHINEDTKGTFKAVQNAYAELKSNTDIDITSAITISAWIKVSSLANMSIVSKESAYNLSITSGGEFSLGIFQSAEQTTSSSSAGLLTNMWYYISASYDGTTTKLYLNGVENTSSSSVAGAIDSNTNSLFTARKTAAGANVFTGLLDDLTIHSRALSENEILNSYRATLSEHT